MTAEPGHPSTFVGHPLMRIAGTACIALTLATARPAAAGPSPGDYAAFVADPARPAGDVKRDAVRKPAETLAFMQIEPGQKVGERFPGDGYFTRLLSKAVGPAGHVYILLLQNRDGSPYDLDKAEPLTRELRNVSLVKPTLGHTPPPEPLDRVITIRSYHDMHSTKDAASATEAAGFNAGAYRALRPGGIYVVIDHAALKGKGASQTGTLHRIEDVVVQAEAKTAGFVPAGRSEALRNPADDGTLEIWNPKIDDKDDQFMLKFRKP